MHNYVYKHVHMWMFRCEFTVKRATLNWKINCTIHTICLRTYLGIWTMEVILWLYQTFPLPSNITISLKLNKLVKINMDENKLLYLKGYVSTTNNLGIAYISANKTFFLLCTRGSEALLYIIKNISYPFVII